MRKQTAFSLIELLVAITVVAVLAALSAGAFGRMRRSAQGVHCANSLRQLGVAMALYLGEHNNEYVPYVQSDPDGRLWYFGLEPWSSLGGAEGSREVDRTRAPLYPYVRDNGGIEVCPSFPYDSALWKAKFKGASWGYGYNTLLSRVNALTLKQPSRVVVFGDCAQVNTFQAPASAKNPMIEEFYIIDNRYVTVHFRHNARANFLFADGHVAAIEMEPGTQDTRLAEELIGRISPRGSDQYLR